ncbi:GNAT family N-acetyltransferase [Pseudomonas entomophila]|uniref:GNAT family N-acetyltransferase n=2 Tax=Pseudomonas entomophila TaxID=312306 RepID=A0ABY9QMG4_9PSED|nr:GNAT family N-acetyltransferase [Pseudomonas entomophila]WMW04529.1 GNAT family N-acetyltransferase [Pseudomonas entomophila]CAK14671.1 putative acetyltransferase, GNAT family [Pseudomonas entomophila L48]
MHIRLAEPKDLPALIAIDSVTRQDPRRAGQITAWLGQYRCLIAEVGGTVAAYAVMHRHFFGCAFIEMLMVGESHRRSGLGAALVAHMQAECRGQKLFTSTNRSNTPMRRLLERQGFVESGVVEHLDEGDPEQVYFQRCD